MWSDKLSKLYTWLGFHIENSNQWIIKYVSFTCNLSEYFIQCIECIECIQCIKCK